MIMRITIDADKPAMKHVLRSIIKEIALSVDPKTVKVIAEKYVEVEHEINYQASQAD